MFHEILRGTGHVHVKTAGVVAQTRQRLAQHAHLREACALLDARDPEDVAELGARPQRQEDVPAVAPEQQQPVVVGVLV